MEKAQMTELLQSMTDESDSNTLSSFLTMAGEEILNRLYPFEEQRRTAYTVPNRYRNLQVKIAAYHLNKRGAEGELTHTENGITRMYESVDTPVSLLREITPYASSIGGGYREEPEA